MTRQTVVDSIREYFELFKIFTLLGVIIIFINSMRLDVNMAVEQNNRQDEQITQILDTVRALSQHIAEADKNASLNTQALRLAKSDIEEIKAEQRRLVEYLINEAAQD